MRFSFRVTAFSMILMVALMFTSSAYSQGNDGRITAPGDINSVLPESKRDTVYITETRSALACALPLKLGGSGLAAFGLGLAGFHLVALDDPCSSSDCTPFAAIFFGAIPGYVLGGAVGATIVGHALGEDGNFFASLLGSVVGTSLGLLGGDVLGGVGLTFPIAGAVIGYNLSRSDRSSRTAGNTALLNLAGGHLEAGFPLIRPELDSESRRLSGASLQILSIRL